jgi:regulatory protein SWI6
LSTAVAAKREQLGLVQAQLHAATSELAQYRREIQRLQLQNTALDNIAQKVKNLEISLDDEATYAWADGAKIGTPKPEIALTAGPMRVDDSCLASMSSSSDSEGSLRENGAVFRLPSANTLECLVQLRKMKAWQSRSDTILSEQSANIKERSTEKELQCKQIVSLCTGVALEHIDEVTSIAMDSV